MNKNSPLNQRYICPIGADGIQETDNEIYRFLFIPF